MKRDKSSTAERILMISILILMCLMTFSCTFTKELFAKKDKSKVDTSSTETGTIISKRPGDTLTFTVPTIVYKDTTITRRGNTTTLDLRYNKEGQLDSIRCISDEINELKNFVKYTLEQRENDIKIREKQKETTISEKIMLYVFLGLAFLMVVNYLLKKLP